MSMTTTDLATEFDTTPRTLRNLRKFLRSPESGIESVGKGSRYTLPSGKRDIGALRKRFDTWTQARAEKVETDPEGTETE